MISKKLLFTLAVTATLISVASTANAETLTSTHRLSGATRYETSIAVSKKGWTTSDVVIIASGENYADALVAEPLAKKYDAPLLLTTSTAINSNTLSELKRLKAKKVIISGGNGAVSSNIETELKASGYEIQRIGGKDRYETSVLIAKEISNSSSAIIASGENFPDALSISSIAGKLKMPILLSSKDGISDSVKKYISENKISKVYIVGGEGAISKKVEEQLPNAQRIAGSDRYETNLAIIKEFSNQLDFTDVYMATGEDFADALSGGALANKTDSPILLTNNSIKDDVKNYLKFSLKLNSKAIAFGGSSVISDASVKSVMDTKAKISVAKVYDKAGIYNDGQIDGNVIIASDGVTLSNMKINGNLLIASTVNDGNVVLDGTSITGQTFINGGGSHSVHVHNSILDKFNIDKPLGEDARIVLDNDSSSIGNITIESNGIVDTTKSSTSSNITICSNANAKLSGNFESVNISGEDSIVNFINSSVKTLSIMDTAKNSAVDVDNTSRVTLISAKSDAKVSGNGEISKLSLQSSNASIDVQTSGIKTLEITESAPNAKVNLEDSAKVENLLVNAPIDIKGKGKIDNAAISVLGVNIETKPSNIDIKSGISTIISGEVKTGAPNTNQPSPTTSNSNSGSGQASSKVITGYTALNNINISYKGTITPESLPSLISVILNNDLHNIANLNVIWDLPSAHINTSVSGEYTVYGSYILQDGITNNNSIRPMIKIVVQNPLDAYATTISGKNLMETTNLNAALAAKDDGIIEYINSITDNTQKTNAQNKFEQLNAQVAEAQKASQNLIALDQLTTDNKDLSYGTSDWVAFMDEYGKVHIISDDEKDNFNTETLEAYKTAVQKYNNLFNALGPLYSSYTTAKNAIRNISTPELLANAKTALSNLRTSIDSSAETLPSATIAYYNNQYDILMRSLPAPLPNITQVEIISPATGLPYTLDTIHVYSGTVATNITLPGDSQVSLSDGSSSTLPLNWRSDDYNANTPGTYTFTGTPVLDNHETNTSNITYQIHVQVDPLPILDTTGRAFFEVDYFVSNLSVLLANPSTVQGIKFRLTDSYNPLSNYNMDLNIVQTIIPPTLTDGFVYVKLNDNTEWKYPIGPML